MHLCRSARTGALIQNILYRLRKRARNFIAALQIFEVAAVFCAGFEYFWNNETIKRNPNTGQRFSE